MSAGDKDLEGVFMKLVAFASSDIIQLAAKFGDIKDVYTDEERNKLANSHETLREDVYLDGVFGAASALTNADWLLKSAEMENNWVFIPTEIRKRLCEITSIDEKHHTQ